MHMKTIQEFDHKKATQAINFFACKEGGQIDKLKVIKLIWLVDRYHIRKYGRPIINDMYFAMEYGPVASSVADLAGFNTIQISTDEQKYLDEYLKSATFRKNTIASVKDVDEDIFSDSEVEALEKIYKEYGDFKPFDLVELSHKFPEWKKFEVALESKVTTRELMNYEDFFSNPSEVMQIKNIFNESEDYLVDINKIFKENYQIANCWV